MSARKPGRMETIIERLASAWFAGAAAYAAYSFGQPSSLRPLYVAAVALGAYLLSALVMNMIGRPQGRLAVPIFDLREFESLETDELLLTDPVRDELVLTAADRLDDELVLTSADRLPGSGIAVSDPLVLDDVLAAVGADSRVVRLFDRQAMPTPGQLSSTIDRHLGGGARPLQNDAAQALSEALAELRRSLR